MKTRACPPASSVVRGRFAVPWDEPKWVFGAVLATATTVAAVLAAVSILGARSSGTAGSATSSPPAHAATIFDGIPQHGAALGSPTAPVTLVEYADLQCPYCAQWARSALPVVTAMYVRTGKVRIVFKGLAFIGPDSEQALRTVNAAGLQDHLWDLVEGLYLRQGAENSGWVTDDLVRDVAGGVANLDARALLEARGAAGVDDAIRAAYTAAQTAGVRSTPAFEIGRTGGALEVVSVHSLGAAGITPAIEDALAR